MIKRILLWAGIFLIVSLSCNLFPMKEESFNFLKEGKHFTGDDFELNDGKFSTAHPWVLGGIRKPFLQQEEVYNGEWAVQMEGGYFGFDDLDCFFSLDVNFEIEKEVSFWIKSDSSIIHMYFWCDDSSVFFITQPFWTYCTVSVPPGNHKLKWKSSVDSSSDVIFLDCITVRQPIYTGTGEIPLYMPGEPVVLEWEDGTGGSEYHLQLSGEREFSTTVEETQSLNGEQYTVSASLEANKRYYWRVKSRFPDGTWDNVWSQTCSFIVIGEPAADNFEDHDGMISTLNPWTWRLSTLVKVQNAEKHGGSAALSIKGDSVGVLELIINLEDEKLLSFWIKKTGKSDSDYRFSINNQEMESETSNGFDWNCRNYMLSPGVNTLKWEIDSPSTLYLDDLVFPDVRPFSPDNFDNAQHDLSAVNDYTLSLENAPFLQGDTVFNGSWALEFGSQEYNTDSYFSAFIKTATPQILVFQLKMESNCGTFRIYMDDTQLMYLSDYPASDWHSIYIPVEPGTSLVKWMLDKNYDSNTAWVDDIMLLDVPPMTTGDLITSNGSASVDGDVLLSAQNTPFLQPFTVDSGSWALEFGAENISKTSEFSLNLDGSAPQAVSFRLKMESNCGTFRIYMDDSQLMYLSDNSARDWQTVTVIVDQGVHVIKWMLDKLYDSNTAWVDTIVFRDIPVAGDDDFETNDGSFSTLNTWSLGGDALPFVQASTVNGGSWAVQFGGIGHGQESYFELACYLAASATLRFHVNVDSEGYGDQFELYDNNTRQLYTYTSGWRERSVSLASGGHVLKWRYVKDSSYSSGADTAWVDDITFE